MLNGNTPASPIKVNPSQAVVDQASGLGMECPKPTIHHGLTKREHFAGLAMAAWIQHHGSKDDYGYSDESAAENAVCSADALLAELAK